jgi:hypothetical protein
MLTRHAADLVVHEIGSSLPGALCGSHLGALGMSVTAWRDQSAASGPQAQDWGWDWCKVIRTGFPDTDSTGPPDVLIDGRPLGTPQVTGARVTCRILGDWHLGIEMMPEVVLQATVGLIGYVGRHDAPPIRIGSPVVTTATGIAAVQAVLAGLAWQERRRERCTVTVTAVGVGFALAGNNVTAESDPEERTGFAFEPWAPPKRGFACRDGSVDFVFHRDDGGFQKFCAWLGIPALGADDRFQTHAGRHDNTGDLADALAPALSLHDTSEVLDQLDAAGALFARRVRIDELPADPQISSIGLLSARDHQGGSVVVRLPFSINGSRPEASPVIIDGGDLR